MHNLTSEVHPSSPWITRTLHLTFLCLTPNWVQMRTMMLMLILLLPVSVSWALELLSAASPAALLELLYPRSTHGAHAAWPSFPEHAHSPRTREGIPRAHQSTLDAAAEWDEHHADVAAHFSMWRSASGIHNESHPSLHPSILNRSPVTCCSFGLSDRFLDWIFAKDGSKWELGQLWWEVLIHFKCWLVYFVHWPLVQKPWPHVGRYMLECQFYY